MTAQHTPGPWELAEGEKSLLKIMATTPRGLKKSIAQVGGYGGDSRPANARLIAAAPELLEAARAGILYDAAIENRAADGASWITGDDLDLLHYVWIITTRAAIAKAEGDVE